MAVSGMNKGSGDTSYAKNSSFQGRIISTVKPLLEETITTLLSSRVLPWDGQGVGFADLGCSAGPNALAAIFTAITTANRYYQRLLNEHHLQPPSLRAYLNDLPVNDFNTVFTSLPAFEEAVNAAIGGHTVPSFVMAVPGSFYGRLFPDKSLHIVHSSTCLHWLSQVPSALTDKEGAPMNRGQVYMTHSTPQWIVDAYHNQFVNDFKRFLAARSLEVVKGGRMVLSIPGRRSEDPPNENEFVCIGDLLNHTLTSLVAEGVVEEEKMDTFNIPWYLASAEEIEAVVREEGSFKVERLEVKAVRWVEEEEEGLSKTGPKVMRAIIEPLLKNHFGAEVMECLFRKLAQIVAHDWSRQMAGKELMVVNARFVTNEDHI